MDVDSRALLGWASLVLIVGALLFGLVPTSVTIGSSDKSCGAALFPSYGSGLSLSNDEVREKCRDAVGPRNSLSLTLLLLGGGGGLAWVATGGRRATATTRTTPAAQPPAAG